MTLTPRLDILGAALADTSRSQMLCELMDGRAFTSKELASAAGISPQTASVHLKHLQRAGLISSLRSGRCLYHRIAGEEIAQALETLATLAPADHLYRVQQRKGGKAELLVARSCYDHLAGRLGVALADSLNALGDLIPDGDQYTPVPSERWMKLGVHLPNGPGKRPFARACLDWTQRKHHIAGPLAKQLLTHALASDWVQRQTGKRGLLISATGLGAFEQILAIPSEFLSEGAA
ncbi:transcriptional regulator [Phaeobacter gallaeciensis]|uniref:Transcriptional regulator n=1 Tax=Phaeobacter gallaeciensis TaxID=60890 RepID=A0A366X019_9RHOB|nr:helix-turn-helix domain-containing protein [Phaeobacter gallaeciensis]RBW53919.1 transcriptional regulator [Phaeobacter gallaeciensis]